MYFDSVLFFLVVCSQSSYYNLFIFIAGMAASQGVLTARGGMTSHAAVVARGMNLPCIAGCPDITVNEKSKTLLIKGRQGEIAE